MQVLFILNILVHLFLSAHQEPSVVTALPPVADSTDAMADSTPAVADTLILREIVNQAFATGEKLEYEVKFGAISAGEATLSIPDTQFVGGRACYHVVSKMSTNDFFSSFYRVNDLVESLIDIHGIFPWRFKKQIREGKYKANRNAAFDHLRGLVYESKKVIPIPPFSQDVLSIFYYIRTQELKVGQPLQVDSYSDKKHYPLTVQVLKREKIKVPAGKFDCFMIEPAMRTGSIFEQKGKMWIWYSNDKRRLPVLIKSKINVVGSLSMELKKITPGGGASSGSPRP